MKISTKGRYAIEALTYMASLSQDDPIKVKTISDYTNISTKYLEQIFFILRKENILTTKRGANGGYLFLTDIKNLTAGDIVKAVEGSLAPVTCVENLENCTSQMKNECITRSLWIDIYRAVDEILEGITLYELKEAFIHKVGEST